MTILAIIVTLLIFLSWVTYSITVGKWEGIYWDKVSRKIIKKTGKEHGKWTIQRGLVIIGLGLILAPFYLWYTLAFPFICAGCFMLIHDGFYYMKRNDLNPDIYIKRFVDCSTTSTAEHTYNFKTRLAFLWLTAIGLFVLIYSKFLI